MELTEEQYERIQKYADGDMNPEEQEAFLHEVNGNIEMQNSLDLELAIREHLFSSNQNTAAITEQKQYNRFDDPDYIRSLINKSGVEYQQKKNIETRPESLLNKAPVSFKLWPSIAVAASVILVVSVLLWLFSTNSSLPIADKPEDSVLQKKDSVNNKEGKDSLKIITMPEKQINYARLYNNAYKRDDAPAEVPQLLADAMLDYEDGDYRKLQNYNLNNFPRTRGEPVSDQKSQQSVRELGHYYKGISFMETKGEAKAITNLNWVIDSAYNPQLRGKAQWYLALLNVRKGNKKDAIDLLEAVAANNKIKPYNSKAIKLLQLLK